MKQATYLKIKEKEKACREELLSVNPFLTDDSGIYFLTRCDENGIKYAYIGQAKHILSRLVQHMNGCEQHIDLSIRKHGFIHPKNLCGWMITFEKCAEEDLDILEKKYIKTYAQNGYQLRNKTLGGQGQGKSAIAENKPSKGYYDGIKQGRKQIVRELQKIAKYINVAPKGDGKIAKRMAERFGEILKE